MAYIMFLRREEDSGSAGLGLGWLLAIALCGGVLLFTAIGLLLAWWVKKRAKSNTEIIYGGYSSERSSSLMPSSARRLIKRRFLMTSTSTSGLSSSVSSRFSLPPVLPPLPTYNNLGNWISGQQAQKGRKRSKSWVDEDDLHGPRMNKGAKEEWFGRDSWHGLVPTLPNLREMEKGEQMFEQEREIKMQHEVVQPRYMTLEQEISEDEMRGSGVQVPEQAHMRPLLMDTDLKVILHSTEMRLQHPSSLSPVKTPMGSPVKGPGSPIKASPAKTPRSSHRAMSSQGSVQDWRITPSPSKKAILFAGTPHTASSIGSAANSLIAAATQELALPGGISSPSKARANHWEQQFRNTSPVRPQKSPLRPTPPRQSLHQQQPQQQHIQLPAPQIPPPPIQYPLPPKVQQLSGEKRRSRDSDESSTLSTLYSINEPEEKKPELRATDDDPFVERGLPRRRPSWQARQGPMGFDSLRRAKTLTMSASQRSILDESALPQPLRPSSVATHGGLSGVPIVIEPSITAHIGSVQRRSKIVKSPALSEVAPSEASFVSVSVDSDSDATEIVMRDTPKPEWLQGFGDEINRSRTTSPEASTVVTRDSELSSSPYDEKEMMSLLMATTVPRRALPLPPPNLAGPDGNIIPTGLTPRPKSIPYNSPRRVSSSSSVYTMESSMDPGSMLTGSPSRRSTIRSLDGPAVANTVAELRRMNSVVSTYSVASMTSTVIPDGDSPTLPRTFSNRTPKSRSMVVNTNTSGTITSRYYSNMNRTGNSRSNSIRGQRHPAAVPHHRGNNLLSPESHKYGNENRGLGVRISRITDSPSSAPPSGGRRSAHIGRDSGVEFTRTSVPVRPRLSAVDELIAEERRLTQQRESIESLGLYDKDGFLLSSPEREARYQGMI
ncbi:hypothetical protein PT974_07165 [Cladobotryum mycophilum]|uniref:Uncharacterized protein n=1 Tax=Cladobotryum mycophilum TaxID=491253 RepID=A0ABR0SNQ0_9HYPO